MLKSRMSFVVSEINKTEKFLYHQTFYEGQSDGFCMISVQNFIYLLLSDYLILFRSFVPSDHSFFAPRTHGARAEGWTKSFK